MLNISLITNYEGFKCEKEVFSFFFFGAFFQQKRRN